MHTAPLTTNVSQVDLLEVPSLHGEMEGEMARMNAKLDGISRTKTWAGC